MSRHLLKVLFLEKFEPDQTSEFLALLDNYMIVENLTTQKRNRLLKFKSFVQQYSHILIHGEDQEQSEEEEEDGIDQESEPDSEGLAEGAESYSPTESILGLVVAPASFVATKSSKASSFEREYNLSERRRKTLEKRIEATEVLRKIELEEQLRTSPNKLSASSPTKVGRAAEVAADLSKTLNSNGISNRSSAGDSDSKVAKALSESNSESG